MMVTGQAKEREITTCKDMYEHINTLLEEKVITVKEAQILWKKWENNKHKLNHCLLYTSPSPRDRTRSRMPSSA